jgi:hypothetical protein
VARASATIKFLDEEKTTLLVDPRKLLGIQNLPGTIVVVSGEARRESEDTLVVIARGLFVRPEPVGAGQ